MRNVSSKYARNFFIAKKVKNKKVFTKRPSEESKNMMANMRYSYVHILRYHTLIIRYYQYCQSKNIFPTPNPNTDPYVSAIQIRRCVIRVSSLPQRRQALPR